MTAPPSAVQPVIDAILAAVRQQGVPIGDSVMPTREGTKPWIVAWFDAGALGRHTMASQAWTVTLTAHCLGLSAEAARIATAKLAAAVQSTYRMNVGGQLVQWPEQTTALPVSRDDDTNPPQYDATVEWRLRTSPA